jgi:periplasmic protein CpxP/Spy
MKFKNISLLAALALSLTAVPHAAIAKPTQSVAQNQQTPRDVAAPPQIKLSAQQKTRIDQIRTNVRSQIEKVLTDSQRKQVQAGLKAGQPPRQVFSGLKFTPQQQQDLRQIMVNSQQQIEGVLTAQQKLEIKRYQQSVQNARPSGQQPR